MPNREVPPERWALGYLRGRVRGYRRGSVTLQAVSGAVETARWRGVSDDAINSVLQASGLSIDPVKGLVDDERTG